MVSHHPARFGDHKLNGSGDIMFLVAEADDSRCSCCSRRYFLFLKDIGNSDPGH